MITFFTIVLILVSGLSLLRILTERLNKKENMSEFNFNGAKFTGKNLTIANGKVIIDGKVVQGDDKDLPEINITITGDVEKIEVDYCKTIKVNGNVKKLSTTSGDVEVTQNVEGDVNSTSGSIDVIGNIHGSAQTVSGSIKCNQLKGNASTVSGNIK